jgi:DNA replication protein DnaD
MAVASDQEILQIIEETLNEAPAVNKEVFSQINSILFGG